MERDPLFVGTHNERLAADLKPTVSSAQRFVSIFFYLAVASFLAVVAILIASIVLQSQAGKLLVITTYNKDIPLQDGRILKAVVTRPLDTKLARPLVFELTNKRTIDVNNAAAWSVASELATRGLIVVQVDAPGTGATGGKAPSFYPLSKDNIDVGVELVHYFSKFNSANGDVGMFGLGTSATLALLVAQRKPSALKAIAAVHPADNMFQRDAFSAGKNFQSNLYKTLQEHLSILPQSPDYPLGTSYNDTRLSLDVNPPLVEHYLTHQTDDEFWQAITVKPENISIPVYLIAGLYNLNKDAVIDMYPKLLKSTPKTKLVIGPYDMTWPEESKLGGKYGARADVASWFKQWLADDDNGFMREPDVVMFYRDYYGPLNESYVQGTFTENIRQSLSGKWRYEGWPLQRSEATFFAPKFPVTTLQYHAATGFELGSAWGPLPVSNVSHLSNVSAVIYDAKHPTSEARIINGLPLFAFNALVNVTDIVTWNIRLEDEAVDGSVQLVTGSSFTASSVAGTAATLTGRLAYTTWVFPPSHKIRVSISLSAPGMQWAMKEPLSASVSPAVNASHATDAPLVTLPIVTMRTGRASRTPRFTTASPLDPFDSPLGFPYNRTFAVSRIGKSPTTNATVWYESHGRYYNADDTLIVTFVGQEISVLTNAAGEAVMTRTDNAHSIIIPYVTVVTPDDPPGSPSGYLHDFINDLETAFSYSTDPALSGGFPSNAKNARPIPNLAYNTHRFIQVESSSTITSNATGWTLKSSRTAWDTNSTLPLQTYERFFPFA